MLHTIQITDVWGCISDVGGVSSIPPIVCFSFIHRDFFCTFYHRVFGNSGEKLHQLAGVPLLTNTRAELAARQRRRGRK